MLLRKYTFLHPQKMRCSHTQCTHTMTVVLAAEGWVGCCTNLGLLAVPATKHEGEGNLLNPPDLC